MNTAMLCRRMIFTQVLLGIVAACMAEKNPGLLLVAGAIGAMSWYLTEGPTGRFLPRWSVNLGAILATAWLAIELVIWRSHVVGAMSHFILVLQLLMLYARKSDREYSQLLVLSLLQMISASVLSISMIYGIFLAVYCVVALVTVLLFHLTTAADRVYQATLQTVGPRGSRPNTLITVGARRQLRLTAIAVGLVCGVIAAAVFVVVPRNGESAIDLGSPDRRAPVQAGFSNTVRLGAGAIGTGSREPMLNLAITSGGQPIGQSEEPWLVRGAALDQYDAENHTWARSNFAIASDQVYRLEALNRTLEPEQERRSTIYTAEIALRDARQRTLFGVVPAPFRHGLPAFDPTAFRSNQLKEVIYSNWDQQLQANETDATATSYQLDWPLAPARSENAFVWPEHNWENNPPFEDFEGGSNRRRGWGWGWRPEGEGDGERSWRRSRRRDRPPRVERATYARTWAVESERVREFALRILREQGLNRDPEAEFTDDDLKITAALAEYLRTHYTYDLDNPPARQGQDPIIQFLFERRRGHCELFASGLAALCRSINIPARLITGFRASEFNSLGEYYVVRQSNAHAWTEVYGGPGRGWYTFDATPAAEVEAEHRAPDGWLASIRRAYEHVEFAWIRTVVAFDSRTRKAVMGKVGQSFKDSKGQSQRWLEAGKAKLTELRRHLNLDRIELLVIGLSALGLLIAGTILLRLYLVRRRRLARLQLVRLPVEQRRSLGRQLGFYLNMLDILERHGHRRPTWQSPYGFATQLAHEHPLVFDPVVALTEIFYSIRFGHRSMDAELRQRIRVHLGHLEQTIADKTYRPDLPPDFHDIDEDQPGPASPSRPFST